MPVWRLALALAVAAVCASVVAVPRDVASDGDARQHMLAPLQPLYQPQRASPLLRFRQHRRREARTAAAGDVALATDSASTSVSGMTTGNGVSAPLPTANLQAGQWWKTVPSDPWNDAKVRAQRTAEHKARAAAGDANALKTLSDAFVADAKKTIQNEQWLVKPATFTFERRVVTSDGGVEPPVFGAADPLGRITYARWEAKLPPAVDPTGAEVKEMVKQNQLPEAVLKDKDWIRYDGTKWRATTGTSGGLYMDQFLHVLNGGTLKATGSSDDYQAGHIVAHNLGGGEMFVDFSPDNFFLQHAASNKGLEKKPSSNWYAAEMFIGDLLDDYAECRTAGVEARPEFVYPHYTAAPAPAANGAAAPAVVRATAITPAHYTPTGGNYTISTSARCWHAVCAKLTPALPKWAKMSDKKKCGKEISSNRVYRILHWAPEVAAGQSVVQAAAAQPRVYRYAATVPWTNHANSREVFHDDFVAADMRDELKCDFRAGNDVTPEKQFTLCGAAKTDVAAVEAVKAKVTALKTKTESTVRDAARRVLHDGWYAIARPPALSRVLDTAVKARTVLQHTRACAAHVGPSVAAANKQAADAASSCAAGAGDWKTAPVMPLIFRRASSLAAAAYYEQQKASAALAVASTNAANGVAAAVVMTPEELAVEWTATAMTLSGAVAPMNALGAAMQQLLASTRQAMATATHCDQLSNNRDIAFGAVKVCADAAEAQMQAAAAAQQQLFATFMSAYEACVKAYVALKADVLKYLADPKDTYEADRAQLRAALLRLNQWLDPRAAMETHA